jgi:hypothetical protein
MECGNDTSWKSCGVFCSLYLFRSLHPSFHCKHYLDNALLNMTVPRKNKWVINLTQRINDDPVGLIWSDCRSVHIATCGNTRVLSECSARSKNPDPLHSVTTKLSHNSPRRRDWTDCHGPLPRDRKYLRKKKKKKKKKIIIFGCDQPTPGKGAERGGSHF